MIVASIHQPSSLTFGLFDKLLLLSQGRVCYNGPVTSINDYLDRIGMPMPLYINPAEFLLDLISTDFSTGDDEVQIRIKKIHSQWTASSESTSLAATLNADLGKSGDQAGLFLQNRRVALPRVTLALLQRSFIKSYRDVVAYGIRFAMYIGLAVMMGTVWLRLSPTQSHIQPFINAIVGPILNSRPMY